MNKDVWLRGVTGSGVKRGEEASAGNIGRTITSSSQGTALGKVP